MTYPELIKNIQGKKFSNAYFLYGVEDFLMEDALKKLVSATVDPATKDFNYDLYYAGETDAGKIVDTANAYPMMAESRVVVVKELQKLPLSGLEFLGKYLEKPAQSTKLVLLNDGPVRKNKAIKKIQTNTCSVEFKPLYERQISRWIQDHLRERAYQISEDAALLIHARVGTNLRVIVNELDKILLNLDERKKIEMEDVREIVGSARSFSLFDLNDAVGEKDLHKSLLIVNQMLVSGESATGVVARITRHFVNLVKINGAAAKGKSTNEMTALTGIPSFFINKSLRMTRKYGGKELQHAFEALLDTDLILKSSQQSPLIALQSMIIRIIKCPDSRQSN